MELYTISSTYHTREAIIEEYDSLIWTERYAAYGEFELVVDQNPTLLARLQKGAILGMDATRVPMFVTSVQRSEDADGRRVATIKGRSFTWFFQDRPAKLSLNWSPWTLSGTVGDMVVTMVRRAMVTNWTGISGYDSVSGLTVSNAIEPDPNGPEPSYSIKIKPDAILYDQVRAACEAAGLGFRVTKNLGDDRWFFSVYRGWDLSGDDWDNGRGTVTFSAETESLSEVTSYESDENYKNTAYVVSLNGSRIVYRSGQPYYSGLSRRVILVDATDITTAAGSQLQLELEQRGRDVLAEHQETDLFDGKISQTAPYKFGEYISYEDHGDYYLGDIVNLVDDMGAVRKRRVTEYIWTHDSSGERSYPTLSAVGGV